MNSTTCIFMCQQSLECAHLRCMDSTSVNLFRNVNETIVKVYYLKNAQRLAIVVAV